MDEWLSKGFEREWAPQVMILSHQVVGGFMTHRGWNSTLEGVTEGVTRIIQPSFVEQFINEKLIVSSVEDSSVSWSNASQLQGSVLLRMGMIEMAVVRFMGEGAEAEHMRKRGKGAGRDGWQGNG